MDKLGITIYNEKDDDNNKDFQDFVNNIYFPCKELGIHPTLIIDWIKDLQKLAARLRRIIRHDSFYNDHRSTEQDLKIVKDSLERHNKQNNGGKKGNGDNDNQSCLIDHGSPLQSNLSGIDNTNQHNLHDGSNFHGLLLSDLVTLISQVQKKRQSYLHLLSKSR